MNPQEVQLLFVHLQTSLVAGSRTVGPDALTGAATALAEVGAILGLPMTFVVVPGQGDLIPGLQSRATSGNTFPGHAASAFLDAGTVAALAAKGRRSLVVAGFATEVATLHSCLDAVAADYRVSVPVDATGGLSDRTEAAAFRQLDRAGCLRTSVHSLAAALAPDFTRSPGRELLDVLRKLQSGS